MKAKLTIVGTGMGEEKLLTEQARETILKARRTLTTSRLADSFKDYADIEMMSLSEIEKALLQEKQDTTVLVSGDVGFYSLGTLLSGKFSEDYEVELIPGINSMQYLMSRLKKSYQDVKTVSLHGRKNSPVPYVSYNPKVFFLTGGENSVAKIIAELKKSGIKNISIAVGENLSYPQEKITTGEIEELQNKSFAELAVMYVENSDFRNPSTRLKDDDFLRNKTPMTKEHIRELSVSRLDIQPKDVVYDIGAGSGSVSVAMAYKANESTVYAVERNADAVGLIHQNIQELGAHNIEVIQEFAPAGLESLPAPDKVFIGGSGKNMQKILEHLINVSKDFTICVNAITLESLNEAVTLLESYEFLDLEISCINAANSHKLGSYNMMKAENPIYIISGRKIDER